MSLANACVMAVLRSPFHRVLSGSTDVIRYTGRRSGRVITTPTQYVGIGDDLVIMVGEPAAKKWWRNFTDERDLDVLVRGTWRSMRGRAIVGSEEPETMAPLLAAYLERFPRVAKSLADVSAETRALSAVIVRCHPR